MLVSIAKYLHDNIPYESNPVMDKDNFDLYVLLKRAIAAINNFNFLTPFDKKDILLNHYKEQEKW